MKILTILPLFVIMLSACTTGAVPGTQAATQSTALPLPTSTASPAITEAPAATASPTAPVTEMPAGPSPEVTPDVEATLAALSTPTVIDTAPSPDGKWLAEFTRIDCTNLNELEVYAFERLDLVHQADGSRIPLGTQLLACGGLGAAGLGSLGWSENSRYFYFTDAREGVPDGMPCYWERPVYAYDTLDDVKAVLSDGPVSPDGSLLASRMDGELLIWDRNTGETTSLPRAVPGWAVGSRSWSPNGTTLAYVQTESDCHPYGSSALVLVSLADGSQRVHLEGHEPPFQGVEWDEGGRLLLFAEDGRIWKYDPESGEIEPGE